MKARLRRVLVVEDDADLAELLAENLREEGFEVLVAADGRDGLRQARQGGFDVILLDIMLPGLDGISLCRELRNIGLRTPVIVISAKGEERDKVLGLQTGADDYVAKPFGVREIVARIEAVLRRSDRAEPALNAATIGEARIDFLSQEVTRGSTRQRLSHLECEILRRLISRAGDVVQRQDLLQEIWGAGADPRDRSVDHHVVKLRRKLERDSRHPRHLLTIYGEGYRLVGVSVEDDRDLPGS